MKNHPVLSPLNIEEKSEEGQTQTLKPQALSSPRETVVKKAKEVIDAANTKIQTLTDRYNTIDASNQELKDQIADLHAKDQAKMEMAQQYKEEIDVQKQTLSEWKDKMQELSTEIAQIKDKQKENEKQYKNKLCSINDTLDKVYGDSIPKLKYTKMHTKFVVFTERINHLFYYDESGPKLIMVKHVSTENDIIQKQLDRPWFFIVGKRRSALFVAPSVAIRDKWVHFMNRSLDGQAYDQGEDEFSVLTSLLTVDYDIESKVKDDRQTQFASTPPVANRKRNLSSTLSNRIMSTRNAIRHAKTSSLSISRASSLMRLGNHSTQHTKALSTSNIVMAKLMQAAVNEHVHVIVTYDVKDGQVDSFLDAIRPIVIATNKEKGCIRYNMHRDRRNKGKLVMVEEWDSQESLSNHLKQEHLNVYRDLMKKHEVHRALPSVYLCNQVL